MTQKASMRELFDSEQAGGVILIGCTVVSLAAANSPWGESYVGLWRSALFGLSLEHWINDGLMAVFFFFIGLELKREIYQGELSQLKTASLAVIAALGGMIVPALIYTSINYGTPAQAGAGIPMATDIVFAIGILTLLGNRVPASLTVLLTAVAVIDDLGAIVVIAVFYTSSIAWMYLGAAAAVLAVLSAMNYYKVRSAVAYIAGGLILWYCMLHSGVHATIAGVLLAATIPFGDGAEHSLSSRFEHRLDEPVTFGILPIFALANTAIVIGPDWSAHLAGSASSLGIIAGLWVGKPAGIVLFSMLAVSLRLSTLPQPLSARHILGMGLLGGIGFTMSIFITLLAFQEPEAQSQAKIAILFASLLAGISGYAWLRFFPFRKK